jgi:hypothetical protein
MSSFEFIAALMSIIIGLGVTNLLAGAGRAFYRRKENPLDEVHIVFTLATLLLLVLQWWVTFKWNAEVTWSFDRFLVLIVWTITLYMLTVFLYRIYPKRKNTSAAFNETVWATIPRSLRCACSISRKLRFTAISWIRFVPSLCRSLRCPRCHRSNCAPPRLRSVLRVVFADHLADLGTSRETILGRKRDDALTNSCSAQGLIATHSSRARESETACTTRM